MGTLHERRARTICLLVGLLLLAAAPKGKASEETAKSPEPLGPASFGQRGFYHTQAASPFAVRSWVLQGSFEYFKAKGFLTTGDQNEFILTRYNLAFVPLTGLEVHGGFSVKANRNASFAPTETQTMGDPFLGVRYGRPVMRDLVLGAGVLAELPSGTEMGGLAMEGTSARFLLGLDYLPLPGLWITLNAGYHLDNSAQIFSQTLNEAQRFSAGVQAHDQILWNIACAYRWKMLSPFLEYGTIQPLQSNQGFEESPHWITLGLRVWPLRADTLQVLLAVDVALAGVDVSAGQQRIPPYSAILSLAYDFGAVRGPAAEPAQCAAQPPVVETKSADAPLAGRILGQVVDAQSGKPLPGAQIILSREPFLAVVTDPIEGRFATCPLKPGPTRLTVEAEGFEGATEVVLARAQAETPVIIKLQPLIGKTMGRIKGSVRSIRGVPLEAVVAIPTRQLKTTCAKADGGFELDLATGFFDVLISMPGYMTQRRKVKLEAGDLVIVNVELYPKQ